MSVQTFSRFAAQLALDYDLLRKYLGSAENEGPASFFRHPDGSEMDPDRIRQLYGDLTGDEVARLKTGNWKKIFDYIATAGPRPIGGDQPTEPPEGPG